MCVYGSHTQVKPRIRQSGVGENRWREGNRDVMYCLPITYQELCLAIYIQ